MGVKKYLTKLHEQEAIKKGDRLTCKICGREVTINKAGKGPLICCGEPMGKIGTVVEAGFGKYPKGWTNKSVKKFANTLSKEMKGGPKAKGFFDKCVEKMSGKVDNPEGFCAAIKDEVYKSTGWRGKGKPEAEVRKDVKKTKFAVK